MLHNSSSSNTGILTTFAALHCDLIINHLQRHLLYARHHYLVVPRHSLCSCGRLAFAVAGPTAWNSLSDDLRDRSRTLSTDSFRRLLKTR